MHALSESLMFLSILAIPVALCAWTITQTEVFRRFREGMQKWSQQDKFKDPKTGEPRAIVALLAYLPTCYYCTGHYVAESFMVVAWLGGADIAHLKLGYTTLWGLIPASFTLIAISQVYLTIWHTSRVWLRFAKAYADSQEAIRDRIKIGIDSTKPESEPAKHEARKEMNGHPATIPFPGIERRTLAASPMSHE